MSIFSRSTEGHNQDKVSMCTISILQLKKIVNLSQKICAMHLVLIAQAVDLRLQGSLHSIPDIVPVNKNCSLIRDYIRDELEVPFIDNEQICLHDLIQATKQSIQNGSFLGFIEQCILRT